MNNHRITLTRELCHAAGLDHGNRSMRKACRTRWNDEDWNAAAERMVRLAVLGGFAPVEAYRDCTGAEFPYVMGTDGQWAPVKSTATGAGNRAVHRP